MNHSRRQFVRCGTVTGVGLLAGCLGDGIGERADGANGSSANGASSTSCEDLAFDLVDEPPHGPERLPIPDDIDDGYDWDDHHLGEGMETDSAVSFDRIDLRLDEPVVDVTEFENESVLYADLLTSREAFETLAEPVGEDGKDRFEAIDFDEKAIVVVVSGFGSSSVRHEWVRVDDHCEEFHAHGYYVWPYLQDSDFTTRASGIVVEKPDDEELERVWVSLTIEAEVRVNVPTDGAVHAVNDDDEPSDDSDSTGHGAVDEVFVEQVPRDSHGGWRREEAEDTGVVVELTDEEETRAVTSDDEVVDRFVEATAFNRDAVFLVESAGPNLCYETITVEDVTVVAHDDGSFVRGDAKAVDGEEFEFCGDAIAYPAALVRVETDADVTRGEFTITDGWDEEATVESVSVAEFAREHDEID